MSYNSRSGSTDLFATLIAALFLFAVAIVLIIGLGALMAFPVMWLWNFLFTGEASILGSSLPALDFWHAWALLVLTGILVRSGSASASAKKKKD